MLVASPPTDGEALGIAVQTDVAAVRSAASPVEGNADFSLIARWIDDAALIVNSARPQNSAPGTGAEGHRHRPTCPAPINVQQKFKNAGRGRLGGIGPVGAPRVGDRALPGVAALEQHRGVPDVPARPFHERTHLTGTGHPVRRDRNSQFDGDDREPLNPAPSGMTSQEYLETSVEGSSPQEWMNLARALLEELPER